MNYRLRYRNRSNGAQAKGVLRFNTLAGANKAASEAKNNVSGVDVAPEAIVRKQRRVT